VQNRAIEIHDSVLDSISTLDGCVVLDFGAVYIHQSTGTPLRDAGSGWVQKARIRIGDAVVDGVFSELPRDLLDGYLTLDGSTLNNEIPIPLNFSGDVELRMESWGEAVLVKGRSAILELIDEPTYIEEFRPD